MAKPEAPKRNKLTPAEKKIAAELGFDETVLEIIKAALNPEMGIIKKGGLEPEDTSFFSNVKTSRTPSISPADRENYQKIAAEYPELKPVVDSMLRMHTGDETSLESLQKQQMGEAKYKRFKKLQESIKEYGPILEQLHQDRAGGKKQNGMNSLGMIEPSMLESDDNLQKAIEGAKAACKGVVLRAENKSVPLLALKFKGVGESTYVSSSRLNAIKESIESLGYRIAEEGRGIEVTRSFDNREEAEKFLQSYGTLVDTMSLSEQKAGKHEAIYPVDKTRDGQTPEEMRTLAMQALPGTANIDNDDKGLENLGKSLVQSWKLQAGLRQFLPELHLAPGATVKKIGERRWLIDRPARYTAKANIRIATVAKVNKGSSGFELIKTMGTDGTNYGLNNEAIIAKLTEWDKKYGVTVLEAGADSLKIRLTKLPDDISELCTDYFLFCPNICLSDDECSNASTMREEAIRIRKTRELSFWWD